MTADFKGSQVSAAGSLRDAMQALDDGKCHIALVVNDGNHVVGVLTDGDVAAEDPEFLTDVDASELLAAARYVLARYEGPDIKPFLTVGPVLA